MCQGSYKFSHFHEATMDEINKWLQIATVNYPLNKNNNTVYVIHAYRRTNMNCIVFLPLSINCAISTCQKCSLTTMLFILTLWLQSFSYPSGGSEIFFYKPSGTEFFNVYCLARTFFFGTHVSPGRELMLCPNL